MSEERKKRMMEYHIVGNFRGVIFLRIRSNRILWVKFCGWPQI